MRVLYTVALYLSLCRYFGAKLNVFGHWTLRNYKPSDLKPREIEFSVGRCRHHGVRSPQLPKRLGDGCHTFEQWPGGSVTTNKKISRHRSQSHDGMAFSGLFAVSEAHAVLHMGLARLSPQCLLAIACSPGLEAFKIQVPMFPPGANKTQTAHDPNNLWFAGFRPYKS